MRIGTHARVFQHPLTPAEAARHVRSWLAQPVVQLVELRNDHVAQVLELLEKIRVAGSLVTDAQLAALAMDNEAVLHTADADFLRFPGLKWLNPITGKGSAKLRNN